MRFARELACGLCMWTCARDENETNFPTEFLPWEIQSRRNIVKLHRYFREFAWLQQLFSLLKANRKV